MGKRGPAPKPTALKILEGNPGKQKLNKNTVVVATELLRKLATRIGRLWIDAVQPFAHYCR